MFLTVLLFPYIIQSVKVPVFNCQAYRSHWAEKTAKLSMSSRLAVA